MERTARLAPLLEQHSLLGGVDLVRPGPRPGPPVHVDPRWQIGFAKALALVVEHGRKAREATEFPRWSRCPKCQRVETPCASSGCARCGDGGWPSPGAGPAAASTGRPGSPPRRA